MVGSTISVPFIITPLMCMAEDDPDKANIISTLIFVSGIVTLLQSTIGTRLPIIQGSSFSFIVPSLAILGLPQWQCPSTLEGLSDAQKTEIWQLRMREIQGAIIVSSLVEVFLGFFGKCNELRVLHHLNSCSCTFIRKLKYKCNMQLFLTYRNCWNHIKVHYANDGLVFYID